MIKDGQLAIHEVFYHEDGTVKGYTDEPTFPRAESIEELADEIQRYAQALKEPILPHG